MWKKKAVNFVKLGKPFSGTLIAAGIVAFACFTGSILDIPIRLRFLLLITAATIFCGKFICIHNDIMDYECDCKDEKKSNKPLVSGILTIRDAWHYAILTLFLSLFLAAFVSTVFLIVIAVLLFNGFFYNTQGKPRGHIFGNMQVSLATASVIIIGAMVVTEGELTYVVIPLLPCFILSFAYETFREIANATMDIKGDLAVGYKTLPVVVGEWKAMGIGWGFLIFGLVFLLSTLGYGWGTLYNIGVVITSMLAIVGVFMHRHVMHLLPISTRKKRFEVHYRHYLRISILVFLVFVLLEGLI